MREDLLTAALTVQRGLSHQLFRDPTGELVVVVIHPHQEGRDDKVLVRFARLLVAEILQVCRAAPLDDAEAAVFILIVRGDVLDNSKGLLVLLAQRVLEEVHEAFEERVGFQLQQDRRHGCPLLLCGSLGERSMTPDSVQTPTRVECARACHF